MNTPSFTIDLLPLALVVSALVSAITLWTAMKLRQGPEHLMLWAVGGLLVAFGLLLIMLRSGIPVVLSVLVGNIALIAGHVFLGLGSNVLAGKRTRVPVLLGLGAGAVFGTAYVAGAGVDVRIAIISFFLGVSFAMMSVPFFTIWRRGERGFGPALALVALPVCSVLSFIRAALSSGLVPPSPTPGALDTLALVVGIVGSATMAVVLVRIGRRAVVALGRENPSVSASIEIESSEPAAAEDEESWRLVQQSRTLLSPEGVELHLTGKEFLLMQELRDSSAEPVPRDKLNAVIGRDPSNPKDRGVDIMISRLRRRCADAGSNLPVTSVRGRGYIFHANLMLA